METAAHPLVQMVADHGKAPVEQLVNMFEAVAEDERVFVRRVVEMGLLTLEDAWRLYAASLELDFEDFDPFDLDPELLQLLTAEEMAAFRAVPIRFDQSMLVVALENPLDLNIIDSVQEKLQTPILPAIATPQAIESGISARRRAGQGLEALLARLDLSQLADSAFATPQSLKEIAGDDAIVQLVDHILEQALRRKASDIHVEAGREFMCVRLRIDGQLETVITLPRSLHRPIVTRMKLVSDLDISERRRPQDGRFRIQRSTTKAVEFRVSTLPAMNGEKVVLRVLDKSKANLSLADMGFTPPHEKALCECAEAPNGMILVTGPTGSGKSTTLYGVLNHLNRPEKNLITTEDPVEYEMAGITQVQIDKKAGRSFAEALRSILRQDPDVIMVGEIRDHETAEIAVHAAMTGHMVLSTLHTNSSIGTVSRLIDMGIENYLLAPSLRAVVAQRLVRRLCEACAADCEPPMPLLKQCGFDEPLEGAIFKKPVGCPACRRRGYAGRLAVHEVLVWSPAMESLLSGGGGEREITEQAAREEFEPMVMNGARKAMQGLTTLNEILAAARA